MEQLLKTHGTPRVAAPGHQEVPEGHRRGAQLMRCLNPPWGGLEAQEHPWEVGWPVSTGGEGIFELLVTPLHHAVGLRVVGSGEVV